MASLADINPQKSVCIYGYGEYGKILECLICQNTKLKISNIIDDNQINKVSLFSSILIEGFETFAVSKSDSIVLIGTIDDNATNSIIKKLNEHNMDFLIISELVDYIPLTYLFSDLDIENNKAKIDASRALFDLAQDKELYDFLIDFRKMGNFVLKKADDRYVREWTRQYSDFINPKNISTYIDGGLFEGYTTSLMIDNLFSDNNITIYGFEPLRDIFETGDFRVKIETKCNFTPIYKALWSSKTTLNFCVQGTASKITDQSGVAIETTSIDEFVQDNNIQKVDFIKLDIEGAEIEAINGAIKTIQKDRPQLAISIYHKKEHLYEIPLLINSICKDYNYRLGRYDSNIAETILYAIPKEIEIIEC